MMDNIRKVFMNGSIQTEVLRGINLEIQSGEMVAIMGVSGSGKSTLLSIMGGLELPTTGIYKAGDMDISKCTEKQLHQFRCRSIGFVFQKFYLLPQKTTVENVTMPMYYNKEIKRREYEKKAIEALERVNLGHCLESTPNIMSGGECQRAAIARAIVNNPEIILADEPTGNLDSNNSKEIMKLLCSLHEEKHNTVIIVTHDMDIARMCNRTLVVRDGKISV